MLTIVYTSDTIKAEERKGGIIYVSVKRIADVVLSIKRR